MSAAEIADSGLPAPFRPAPIRALNAVGRGLTRAGLRGFSLDEDFLLERASRTTGLSDFGEETFRPGLARLLQSLEEDGKLNTFGRYFARRQVLELLCHRLTLQDYRARHPEVEKQEIHQPLFVLGLPRTGTTLLYGLLAQDPAHRSALSWEVDDPCPPAQEANYASDPRIESSEKRFEQLRQLAPTFQAIHPIGSLLPQECIVITACEFMSIRFEMCFDVAGYQEWMLAQDMSPTYRYHSRFLQHMQSRYAGERWVLKSPGHLGPIDALLDQYPGAMLVQTHRDPSRVIPSVSSLEYAGRGIASDEVDPKAIGQQQLRVWSALLGQGMRARAERPEQAHQIFDLHFHEILSDPLACVRRIYQHFDLELTPEANKRMQAYMDAHPRDKHGEHRYSLDGFGLDQDEVHAAFERYSTHFGVQPEPYER
jgi:hypothetical protein